MQIHVYPFKLQGFPLLKSEVVNQSTTSLYHRRFFYLNLHRSDFSWDWSTSKSDGTLAELQQAQWSVFLYFFPIMWKWICPVKWNGEPRLQAKFLQKLSNWPSWNILISEVISWLVRISLFLPNHMQAKLTLQTSGEPVQSPPLWRRFHLTFCRRISEGDRQTGEVNKAWSPIQPANWSVFFVCVQSCGSEIFPLNRWANHLVYDAVWLGFV